MGAAMCKVIVNAHIVTPEGILDDGALVINNGRIENVLRGDTPLPHGAEIVDAKGAFVGPGFVDIHVHGGGGFATFDESTRAVDHFVKHGTTTLMATPFYTLNFEETLKAIADAKKAMQKSRIIKGIYMEGPYTNPIYGANADKNPWRHGIVQEEFKAIADEGGRDVKVWTIAPELEGIGDFAAYARKVNPKVRFALGHSQAGYEQICALGENRPTLLTHAMNATGRLPTPHGTRGYGPDEYCFATPAMFAELISDSCGIHVKAELQRMLLQIKGVEKLVLITDSTVADSPSPERFAYITDLNFDHNGDLSGSQLTMDRACQNIMTHTHCSMADAFKMASLNPAKMVGLADEIGSIKRGKLADLVFVDEQFHVLRVMTKGAFYE